VGRGDPLPHPIPSLALVVPLNFSAVVAPLTHRPLALNHGVQLSEDNWLVWKSLAVSDWRDEPAGTVVHHPHHWRLAVHLAFFLRQHLKHKHLISFHAQEQKARKRAKKSAITVSHRITLCQRQQIYTYKTNTHIRMKTNSTVFDGEPSPERCIYEQVIFDHIWPHRDLDL